MREFIEDLGFIVLCTAITVGAISFAIYITFF